MHANQKQNEAVNPLTNTELTGPALRTFFNIVKEWDLSETDQMLLLGLTNRSTLTAWKQGRTRTLSSDTLERISYVFGIYSGLKVLVRDTAHAWIKKPNTAPLFGGQSAIEFLRSGRIIDLYHVRRYIDAQRG